MHVIFVCDTNRNLSPSAAGILDALADHRGLVVTTDSAAPGGRHVGEPAEALAIKVAAAHDIDISRHVVRKITAQDFIKADIVIAFDRSDLRQLSMDRPRGCRTEIRLFSSFLEKGGPSDIAQPTGDDIGRYEKAYETVEVGIRQILGRLRAQKASMQVSG